MGQVLAIFRVMPDEPGAEKGIILEIRKMKGLEIRDIKTEDIAFGLKAVIVGVLLEDSEGSKIQEMEKMFSAIKGVSQAEMENSTLL